MSVRVYLPATLELLARWSRAGSIPAVADRFVAPEDGEEAEYGALMSAAEASAEQVSSPGRRVVLVADVADPDGEVAWWALAAVHADTADVDTSSPENLGDLASFAVQEVPDLLA